MPVPAAVHSEVLALHEFFVTGVSIVGRIATTQELQQQLKAFADNLRTSGWRPRVTTSAKSLQSDLASKISEFTALLKNGLDQPSSSSAKRRHEASPADIIAALGTMSAENRAAVLVAFGVGAPWRQDLHLRGRLVSFGQDRRIPRLLCHCFRMWMSQLPYSPMQTWLKPQRMLTLPA